ncbi:MAG TPA: hypothetical protein ENJ53_01930 [Phaeodactylibacter sp.]|nr:hypothetical protein [Phaeodactylibacter sp.]
MKIKLVFILLFFSSISLPAQKTPVDKIHFYTPEDINIEQTFQAARFKNYYNKTYDPSLFFKHYFLPWTCDVKKKRNFAKKEMWTSSFTYSKKLRNAPCYQGSYLAHGKAFIDELVNNINADQYGSYSNKALTTAYTNVRQLPTDEFCFKSVRAAGEGYPFDYFQETTLWINTPVLILHQSNDKQWFYVFNPYGFGWLKAKDVAIISEEQKQVLMAGNYAAVLKDHLAISENKVHTSVNIATILPMSNSKISLPLRDVNGLLVFDTIAMIPNEIAALPIEFNSAHVKKLMQEMLGTKYSWGGLGGGRDCSSTIKDFMTPFGIWLPRNSGEQANYGKVIPLKNISTQQKLKSIVKNGIPFFTTLYKHGHSMLYIGQDANGVPIMFHSPWGLKPKFKNRRLLKIARKRDKYGIFGISVNGLLTSSRFIIGRTVITPIELEKGINHSKKIKLNPFINQIKSIALFLE